MNQWKDTFRMLEKDVRLELRQKTSIAGITLYVVSTAFVVMFAFKGNMDVRSWVAVFWIIALFSATSAATRSFTKEATTQFYYMKFLVSPLSLILSKIIYNTLLITLLNLVGWLVMTLFFGSLIYNLNIFFLAVVLGSLGLANIFTLLSSISARTQNPVLLSIMGFPIIIPLISLLIKLSFLSGVTVGFEKDKYIVIGGLLVLNLIIVILSVVLFPYLWRD
ncbi:MAG: hypothetical protein K1X55_10905 [Chitinophagales bacterium]|nr:hypothetical protein [Chitinophagales bacterium]